MLLLITLALLLLVFVIGTVLLAGGAPAPAPTPTPSTSPGPPAGFWRFEGPGFAIDLPDAWTDETATLFYPPRPQLRIVGLLVRGMTLCPEGYGSLPPGPSGCQQAWAAGNATPPGTATLQDLRDGPSVSVAPGRSRTNDDRQRAQYVEAGRHPDRMVDLSHPTADSMAWPWMPRRTRWRRTSPL